MIKMEPITIPGLSCYQNSMLTMTNWMRDEYYKIFLYSWKFGYDAQEEILSKKLKVKNENFEKELEDIYGICFIEFDRDDSYHFINEISAELLQNRPVGIVLENYYCPWMEYSYHKKMGGRHFFMIIAFDHKGNYICVDTMPVKYSIVIEKEDLHNGFVKGKKCVIKQELSEKKYTSSHIFSHILKNDDFLQDVEFWKESIVGHDMCYDFRKNKFVWNTEIYKVINCIYGSRWQFKFFLEQYEKGQIATSYGAIYEKIVELTRKWGTVRIELIKLFELKQDIKSEFEKIKTKICTILDDEVNIIDMCCNFEQFHCIRCEHENTNEEIYFIDIYSFYNNCDIFFSNKDFKRKKNVPDGRIWSTKNGCFFFPRIIDLDNMGCKQQQLNVQRGVYRKVYILGYATWGNQGGTMIISFSDNSCEEIDLYFSDWTSESNYGECIVWKTEFFLNNEKDIYDGKIFSTEYSFNKLEKEITSLKLPENENIHIFAITLSN